MDQKRFQQSDRLSHSFQNFSKFENQKNITIQNIHENSLNNISLNEKFQVNNLNKDSIQNHSKNISNNKSSNFVDAVFKDLKYDENNFGSNFNYEQKEKKINDLQNQKKEVLFFDKFKKQENDKRQLQMGKIRNQEERKLEDSKIILPKFGQNLGQSSVILSHPQTQKKVDVILPLKINNYNSENKNDVFRTKYKNISIDTQTYREMGDKNFLLNHNLTVLKSDHNQNFMTPQKINPKIYHLTPNNFTTNKVKVNNNLNSPFSKKFSSNIHLTPNKLENDKNFRFTVKNHLENYSNTNTRYSIPFANMQNDIGNSKDFNQETDKRNFYSEKPHSENSINKNNDYETPNSSKILNNKYNNFNEKIQMKLNHLNSNKNKLENSLVQDSNIGNKNKDENNNKMALNQNIEIQENKNSIRNLNDFFIDFQKKSNNLNKQNDLKILKNPTNNNLNTLNVDFTKNNNAIIHDQILNTKLPNKSLLENQQTELLQNTHHLLSNNKIQSNKSSNNKFPNIPQKVNNQLQTNIIKNNINRENFIVQSNINNKINNLQNNQTVLLNPPPINNLNKIINNKNPNNLGNQNLSSITDFTIIKFYLEIENEQKRNLFSCKSNKNHPYQHFEAIVDFEHHIKPSIYHVLPDEQQNKEIKISKKSNSENAMIIESEHKNTPQKQNPLFIKFDSLINKKEKRIHS